ncbi:cell envelope biogenesis protein TolA [Bartonella sp. B41]
MNKGSYHDMKRGLAFSLVAHVALLSLGVFHFTSVVHLPQQKTEAVTVTLASFGKELSFSKGVLNAPVHEVSSVKPTTKPQKKEEALHVGDEQLDSPLPFIPKEKQRYVDAAPEVSLPLMKTQESSETKVGDFLEDPQKIVQQVGLEVFEKESKNEEVTLPQELTATVQEELAEKIPVRKQAAKIALPEKVLPPQFKPKTTRQYVFPNVQVVKKKKEQTIEQILAMEEKKLLNRIRTQGGGAKHSSKQEALGERKKSDDTTKMAQTLVSIAGGCIQKKLKLVALGGDLKNRPIMRLRFYLDHEGMVMGDPVVEPLGGEESQQVIMERQVYAAVFSCQPYADLPRDQYNLWGQGFDFNVDPLQEVVQ